ncbi:uncharacterized protein LOC114357680 [Ostrinia furnacalis]|uniref:uncharacterized protein LOC114357680 n=1 Tax=Ostrinia furnacalis TaxID=93504 RepID=UPI00103A6170|nr:uncharacterized protein LOC114357680 [Ostrinia furnacalis]
MALECWRGRLAVSQVGRRTVQALLPVLAEWLRRRHGRLTYRMTQLLTGHGCFGAFLHRIGREEVPGCHHCNLDTVDTAEHTLQECPAWADERAALNICIGNDLSLPVLVHHMTNGEEAWRGVLTFCEAVISQKEAAEREREASPDAPIARRRRHGQRRRLYDLHLPLPNRPRPSDTGVSGGV